MGEHWSHLGDLAMRDSPSGQGQGIEDSAHCDLHARVKENVSPISQRRKQRPREAT